MSAILAYIFLAILITWPLVTRLTEVLPGASQDSLLHYWNGFAVQQALRNGQSPYTTNLIFYPHGVNLISHNLAWFQILPWLMLTSLIDGIAAYNLVLILNLALSGLAAFVLAMYVTGDGRAAFLSGLIYLSWPFRLSQLDHPNLLVTAMIPLFLLFLLKTLHSGRWRDAGLAAIFLTLVGYGRWQLLIPAALAALILIIWQWRRWWPIAHNGIFWRLLFIGGFTALLLLPPTMLLLRQQTFQSGAANVLREGEEAIMQTDLLAYVIPGNDHFLLREWTAAFYDALYNIRSPSRRYTAYLGLVAMTLSLIALVRQFRKTIPWLLLALLFIGLALGHELRFNGQVYSQIPTLYRLLEPLELFRLMRVPDRYNMFLALPVALMSGIGAAELLVRTNRRWLRNAITVLLAVLILLEYLSIPVTLQANPSSPAFYSDLAQDSGEFAILNLPFDSLKAKEYMFDQIIHGRPIMQGNLSRTPQKAYASIDANALLRTLNYDGEFDPRLNDFSRQLATLEELGIRYIIMHKDLVGGDRILHWQRYLLIDPIYEDSRFIVYRTSFQIGRDVPLLANMNPGIGPVRTLLSASCLAMGETLAVDIGWGSTEALDKDFSVEIAFQDPAGIMAMSETFELSSDWPTNQWPENVLAWEYYTLTTPVDFPPGKYDLLVRLIDSQNDKTSGEPYFIQSIQIQDTPCQLGSQIEGSQAVNTRFGDELSLLAYEFEQDNKLKIRLYWQAMQHMDKDYTIFVHVFEPTTEVPAAQNDAMPHQGAYRTSFWGLEEIVEESIEVWLSDLPVGEYDIAIGVYDAATGERLVAVDGAGQELPDGRLVLPEGIAITE